MKFFASLRSIVLPFILLAACQPMDMDFDDQHTRGDKAAADSVFTLTLRATKTADTKALDLVNNGARLNVYWKDTERVKVFRAGTYIGTLAVIPDPNGGAKPTNATLSGSVEIQDLAVNDVLTLLIPRKEFDYTGQNGKLTGTGSIEDTYDYGMATVTVSSISGQTVTTATDARFQNQQSIYRFEFKRDGSTQIKTRALTIMSVNGKLVQSVRYEGGAWTPVYGIIQIEKEDPSTITNYVSLRNDGTTEDRYSFFVIDDMYKLYMAVKQIPANVLDAPGKFISPKTIDAVPTCFQTITESPGESPVIY